MIQSARSRASGILFLFSFIQGVANGIWGFLPIFLLDLGGSAVDIGLLSMVPGIASTFMQLAWGRVSDRLGNSPRMVSSGFLFSSLLSIPILFSTHPWHVISASTVQSLLGSVATVATFVMLADFLDPGHTASFMGIYNPIGFGGNMLGSFGAGLLIPLLGYRYSLFIYTILAFSMAVLVRYGLPDVKGEASFSFLQLLRMSLVELGRGVKTLPEVMKQGGAYTRWVVGISVRGFGIAMFGPISTVYLVRVLNASTPQIGSLNSLSFGVRMISSPPLGLIADRKGAKRIMLMGVSLAVAYPLLFSLTSDVTQMVPIYMMNGVFWGCINSSWLAWQMKLIPERHGVYAGLLNFINGLEWALGPFLGGFLGEYMGILPSAAASSTIIFLALLILKKVPEREEKAATRA